MTQPGSRVSSLIQSNNILANILSYCGPYGKVRQLLKQLSSRGQQFIYKHEDELKNFCIDEIGKWEIFGGQTIKFKENRAHIDFLRIRDLSASQYISRCFDQVESIRTLLIDYQDFQFGAENNHFSYTKKVLRKVDRLVLNFQMGKPSDCRLHLDNCALQLLYQISYLKFDRLKYLKIRFEFDHCTKLIEYISNLKNLSTLKYVSANGKYEDDNNLNLLTFMCKSNTVKNFHFIYEIPKQNSSVYISEESLPFYKNLRSLTLKNVLQEFSEENVLCWSNCLSQLEKLKIKVVQKFDFNCLRHLPKLEKLWVECKKFDIQQSEDQNILTKLLSFYMKSEEIGQIENVLSQLKTVNSLSLVHKIPEKFGEFLSSFRLMRNLELKSSVPIIVSTLMSIALLKFLGRCELDILICYSSSQKSKWKHQEHLQILKLLKTNNPTRCGKFEVQVYIFFISQFPNLRKLSVSPEFDPLLSEIDNNIGIMCKKLELLVQFKMINQSAMPQYQMLPRNFFSTLRELDLSACNLSKIAQLQLNDILASNKNLYCVKLQIMEKSMAQGIFISYFEAISQNEQLKKVVINHNLSYEYLKEIQLSQIVIQHCIYLKTLLLTLTQYPKEYKFQNGDVAYEEYLKKWSDFTQQTAQEICSQLNNLETLMI